MEFAYSFIIPHKNAPDLVARCVKSIPERADIEVIVVDDNSFAEKKPTVIHSRLVMVEVPAQESKGAGHARNVGLNLAKGRWLLFADCDDYYEEGFINELDAFKESSNDIVCFSSYYNYNPQRPGDTSPKNRWEIGLQKYKGSPKSRIDLMRLLLSTNEPWNKMFKADFVRRNKIYFEEIPICNDAYFSIINCTKASKVSFIEKRLYYYVTNPSGITKSKRPIEHYYLEMKANIRLNKVKMQEGVIDIISLPGFNKKMVLNTFGKIAYFKMYLYKIFHDPTFFPALTYHIYRKLKKIVST